MTVETLLCLTLFFLICLGLFLLLVWLDKRDEKAVESLIQRKHILYGKPVFEIIGGSDAAAARH